MFFVSDNYILDCGTYQVVLKQYKTVQSLFKSHQALLLIGDRCPCLQIVFLTFSPRVLIYVVKICDLLRPQLLQLPFIILLGFFVIGFNFSHTF